MTDLRHRPHTEESTADLVRQATEQISTLVRQEMQLARTELAEKGKRVGLGVGLFAGSGVAVFYAVGALLVAAGLALALVMPGWLAALIVGVVLLIIAGVEALVGRGQVKRGTPLTPNRTVDSVRADLSEVNEAFGERNSR
ncbi:phage holin family protein [Hamadaea sp. NPDC050747]|uniref:phage holin family protein n=1 Tax=Hamadaea sp. NPDC050747 TaxID=3155789 RepID=UPI0033E49BEB